MNKIASVKEGRNGHVFYSNLYETKEKHIVTFTIQGWELARVEFSKANFDNSCKYEEGNKFVIAAVFDSAESMKEHARSLIAKYFCPPRTWWKKRAKQALKKTKRNRNGKETQLRRIISKQAEEIKNLRVLLNYKICEEYTAMQKSAFDWAAKNMHIEEHMPEKRFWTFNGESIMENIAEPPKMIFKTNKHPRP